MADSAKLIFQGKEYNIPVITGSENEKALDISSLRAETGLITLDDGFGNTGSCKSDITYLDGEKGILRYRGYPIEQLAEHSNFLEVAYLLIYGNLPKEKEFKEFENNVLHHTMVHEDLRKIINDFPVGAHPMAILSSLIGTLSSFYSESSDPRKPSNREITTYRLLAKAPTLAAMALKKFQGQPVVYPNNKLKFIDNFLNMLFSVPTEKYEISPDIVKAMNVLLILFADHEQSCSTSTVRLVGSSQANLYASVASAIYALWGPLHGGASQAVCNMLIEIRDKGGDVKNYLKLAKDRSSGKRLMGFGHRVYKQYDPKATIIKKYAYDIVDRLGKNNELLDIARTLEEAALKDSYFIERKLFPNVDFYSGLILLAIGIPRSMFTVMFSIGRLPGWIAHWKEMLESPKYRIGRPRQIYNGAKERKYISLNERK